MRISAGRPRSRTRRIVGSQIYGASDSAIVSGLPYVRQELFAFARPGGLHVTPVAPGW
jgi:hypothetical protein